jgi:hypothetical protein
MAELNRFTRARLAAIAERALAEAGVAGVLPTPLDEVQRAAGIAARRDVAELPPGVATPGRELLGALWFERREVFVDLSQPGPRRRFTDAHETMHALCPWHEAVLREDTDAELFRDTALAIEAEANHGAGLLIFQGRRFAERIADAPRDLATVLALAEAHGASLQATLHQFAEHHPAAVALLAIGRFPQRDGRLPLWARSRRRRSGAASAASERTSRPAGRCASWSRRRVASPRPRPRACGCPTRRARTGSGPRRPTTTAARSSCSWPASAARRAGPCPTRSAAALRRARTPSAP